MRPYAPHYRLNERRWLNEESQWKVTCLSCSASAAILAIFFSICFDDADILSEVINLGESWLVVIQLFKNNFYVLYIISLIHVSHVLEVFQWESFKILTLFIVYFIGILNSYSRGQKWMRSDWVTSPTSKYSISKASENTTWNWYTSINGIKKSK